MSKETILVVDDEKEIANLIGIYLKNEGYDVIKLNSGNRVIEILTEQDVHLVILDIMMPGIDGLEVCRRIRQEFNIPIIMLSAKSEDMDKIMGLSTGADDYITKPFNPLELVARVKSQLRRFLYLNPNNDKQDESITIEDMKINPISHTVSIDGREINLTPTEFDILLALARNRGKVMNTEEIFKEVWKEKYLDSNNTVMVHIRKIREKTEDNFKNPKYIKTVWGVGYKIED